ncbi:MAG TPA: MFS transporter [Burkholderiaceae bacterium]|nr:MFS transporter [Burkholderiaceae bacterium]
MKPPEQATATPPSPLGSHQGWLLAVCCAAQFMVILDLSIVNVALPTIQTDLGFSAPDLQWVVNAYAITFAGFLMLGGRAADFFGQQRTFAASLLLFALASLAGGLAPDQGTLIAARGVQGFAGALMAATSLAIITSSFQGPALARAVGLWASMNGLGGAAGMLFGGIITETLGWRWILLINLPIGIASAVAARTFVADRRRSDEARFDIPGAITLTLGQMILIYGVVQASTDGWSAASALIPIIAGLAVLGSFAFIESRLATAPLVPFRELTKHLQVANTVVLLFSAALFPMWFIGSLYLQQVLGLSPLKTGLTFLPMALTIMFCARSAGGLVNRFGVRAVLGGGLTMLTTGMLLFTRIEPSGSAVGYVMIPGILTAAGIALSIVPSTIAATQGAKQGQAGLASGLVNTSRQVGGGLGLALLITLATQHTSDLIGQGESVPDALTGGFRLGYLIGAGFAAAALILTLVAMPKTERAPGARRIAPITAIVGTVTIAFIALAFAAPHSPGDPIGEYTKTGAMSFVSQPALHPPQITQTVKPAADRLAPGLIFIAPMYNLSHPPMVGQSGPMILDDNLQPVWFKPEPKERIAGNLSVQEYRGKPVLTWWRGEITNTGQTLSGEYVVVDQNYRPVAKLRGKGGWILTLHTITIDGDRAFVTANRNRPRNISKFGGAYNGAIIDSAVQEYDLTTGKLLHTWSALDHIPPSASYEAVPGNGFPWDAYHVNSIQPVGTDKFLVSLRGTWAAYLVDIASGKIEWTLGGKHSSFEFGDGAKFEWQHDVELHDDSTVTLFDNHCCQITAGDTFVPPKAPSRPLTLKLDEAAKRVTLVKEQPRADNFHARYMGNAQFLENGNVFVGWGSQPFLSEYDSDGNLVLDGRLPGPDQTYRARREKWVGKPLTKPAGAARGTSVYASWNGATEVKSWRVRAGDSATGMKPVATADKSGFETAIRVPQRYAAYAVEALDASGAVLAKSPAFRQS